MSGEWDAFDVNFPDYRAKPELGRFVEAARQYGFRVMLHVNLVGVSPYHPLYAEIQKFQYRDPWSGNPIGWYWDRTDSPNRIAFMNPASADFRKYFCSTTQRGLAKIRRGCILFGC